MLAQQVTLSTGTLLNLIRRRDGEPHTVLTGTAVWRSPEAERAETGRADRELTAAGLHGRGGVDRGLLQTVDAIARPQIEYYGWISGGFDGKGLKYTLLAGSAGGEAFVLARNTEQEGVVLVSVHPAELLTTFVGQIPGLTAGRGRALLVPKSQLDAGRPRDADFNQEYMRGSRPSSDSVEADELRRVLGLRRLGGGSLYVAGRGRSGSRQRVERPLNYIDTVEGRWLTEEVPGSGEPMIAVTPTTPQLLTERLQNAQSRLPI